MWLKNVVDTYGSGVWNGVLVWRTYWVLWKIRKARDAKKSRAVRSPAAGLKVKPVHFFMKFDITSSCGTPLGVKILSS